MSNLAILLNLERSFLTFEHHMQLSQIPGQDELESTILGQVGHNKWPHTVLLSGRQGTPGLAMALAISELLMTNGLDSSKEASTREKIRKLIHPDVHFAFPVQGAKKVSDDFLSEWRQLVLSNLYCELSQWGSEHASDRGQLNIGVSECNNITKKLSLKAFEGGKKVLIVWGAEYLGKEGNRLLKLFEEPSANTFIILITENVDQILPTILSRCQLYKIKPIAESDLVKFLIDQEGMNELQAKELAIQVEGNLSQAISLAHSDNTALELDVSKWLSVVVKGDFESMMNFAQELNRLGKEQQKSIFQGALSKLRRRLAGIDDGDVIFAGILGDPIDLEIVNELCVSFDALVSGIDRNAHVQALIMAESIKLWKMIKRQKALST